MAKTRHPAQRHVQAAKNAMQQNHDQIMQHLSNIEQAIGGGGQPEQDQSTLAQKAAGAGQIPSGGMPGGMSPLGGKAVG